MRKNKFTEEQVIGLLKQAEAGMAMTEICRKGGWSDATFCKWRAELGGMEASDARRLSGGADGVSGHWPLRAVCRKSDDRLSVAQTLTPQR